MSTTVMLAAAYFSNEIGAEYGVLSQAHYEMVHSCLLKREMKRQLQLPPGHNILPIAEGGKEAMDLRVAEATTRTLVAQSTLAAVLEFFGAQVAGQLSDRIGRRPVLMVASLLMAVCKALPMVRPSIFSVWAAKSGGEALNTICTDALLAGVSDLFASDIVAYSRLAGRLRALGGGAWMVGPVIGSKLCTVDHRMPYLFSTLAATSVTVASLRLPETLSGGNTVGFLTALSSLDPRACLPIGWISMFTRSGTYKTCGRALPLLALALAMQRLPFYGTYDVQDGHARTHLGWTSDQMSIYRTIEGLTDFSQGALAAFSVSRLGPFWGSLAGNLCSGTAFFLQAFSRAGSSFVRRNLMFIGVALLAVPPEAVTEALLINKSAASGVGKGKLMADVSNFTALMKMCGPLFLGRAYFLGLKHNLPSLWGLMALGMHLTAQLILTFGVGLRPGLIA